METWYSFVLILSSVQASTASWRIVVLPANSRTVSQSHKQKHYVVKVQGAWHVCRPFKQVTQMGGLLTHLTNSRRYPSFTLHTCSQNTYTHLAWNMAVTSMKSDFAHLQTTPGSLPCIFAISSWQCVRITFIINSQALRIATLKVGGHIT